MAPDPDGDRDAGADEVVGPELDPGVTEIYEQVKHRLMSHGVYVTEIAVDDDGAVHFTYQTMADDEVLPGEIGRLINVLREFQGEGWEPVDVHGIVTDLEHAPIGTWRAEAEWLRALAADDVSETEFSGRVLGTVEPL